MTHLTPDELIDAMEGMLPPERQAHLSTCADCRRELDELAGVLNEARQASSPEPSPLFWNHFSARVNRAIDAGSANAWPQWLQWQVLLPLGAAAIVIAALILTVPRSAPQAGEAARVAPVAPEALGAPASDDNWTAIAAMVGELDIETASAAGVLEPGMADQAVLSLTADERRELTRLLQAELLRAKS
jgi:hypothetical protein